MDENGQSPSDKRVAELAEAMLVSYDAITLLLRRLPIQIGIPQVDGEARNAIIALLALDRARTLIREEPIPDRLKGALQVLILDWFTAYDLLGLALMGGAPPWRIAALEAAVLRIGINLEEAGKLLPDEE